MIRGLLARRWMIPLIVFVSFFVLNLGIGGPAYLTDEVAYLDKAATLAGQTVHYSTSWFAGYPVMIAPAFLLSKSPAVEWTLIVALNALMWAGSAALLQYILRVMRPNASQRAIFWATLGAMAYPSWLSMSGYAFSTSGFVLVFMAALACIAKSRLQHAGWLALAGIAVGYACWVHPLGLPLVMLFVLLMLIEGLLNRRWSFIIAAVSTIGMTGIYVGIIQPLLNHAMAGAIGNDSHYGSSATRLLHAVTTAHYWLQAGEVFLGILFYAIVATFGLAVYGILAAVRHIKYLHKQHPSWQSLFQDPQTILVALPVLLVLGIMACTAVTSGPNPQLRIDQWVYGRYTDMYILPLIGYSLLAGWRRAAALWTAGFTLGIGLLLTLVATTRNTSFIFDNKVNIQALWPMHVASVVHWNNYWTWGLFGAIGIAIVGFMGTQHYKRFLPLLLLPVLLADAGNYLYHRTIVQQHSTVSTLYQYMQQDDTCVGFTTTGDSAERFNLYSYYLHGDMVEKMSLPQWQKQCGNRGVYLTYSNTHLAPNTHVVGIEDASGLYVIGAGALTQPLQHFSGKL